MKASDGFIQRTDQTKPAGAIALVLLALSLAVTVGAAVVPVAVYLRFGFEWAVITGLGEIIIMVALK